LSCHFKNSQILCFNFNENENLKYFCRSNYVAAYYAAQMMTANKKGLIVNVSSGGGMAYAFNMVYGVGKAAVS